MNACVNEFHPFMLPLTQTVCKVKDMYILSHMSGPQRILLGSPAYFTYLKLCSKAFVLVSEELFLGIAKYMVGVTPALVSFLQ